MMKRLLFVVILFFPTFCFTQITVEFIVTDVPKNITNVGIRGNSKPLSWERSIIMSRRTNNFRIKLEFPEDSQKIEFKFVTFTDDKNPTWEGTQNRILQLAKADKMTYEAVWNVEEIVDISKLPLLQPDELMEDYKLLEKVILEVHPGTYRYHTKAEIEASLAELKAKFQEPLTHGEAYLAMSKVTAKVQCDHTKVGFNNQNKTINSVIHRQQDKMPFTFKWIDNQMIVVYNASDNNELKRGTEILTIDGIDVLEIQKNMLPYIAADGATDKTRLAKMEVHGFDFRYNAFDVFYPLLYHIENNQVDLTIKHFDHRDFGTGESQVKKITVKTQTREERSKVLSQRNQEFPQNRDDFWHFNITDDNIGILTINSFGLNGWKRMTIDYQAFLDEVFENLKAKKVKDLIIDIRKNNGGNDEMKHVLFSYLKPHNKTSISALRVGKSRYTTFPESLKPYVQTWGDNPYWYNMKPDETDTENGYYLFYENNKKQRQKCHKNRFKNNVYLLTSPENTSLAFYTALDFRLRKFGKIVGQETGGNLNDINGGQILFLRLPNSGIEVDFPIIGGFTIKKQPNHGVQPDIVVEPTLEDIYNKIDREMEIVLELIRD
ncbi:MAG: S41 family peptidase [Saprospiraceae bacterium]